MLPPPSDDDAVVAAVASVDYVHIQAVASAMLAEAPAAAAGV